MATERPCPDCGTDHRNIRSMSEEDLSKVLAELVIHFHAQDEKDIKFLLDIYESEEDDALWLQENYGSYLEHKASELITLTASDIRGDLARGWEVR